MWRRDLLDMGGASVLGGDLAVWEGPWDVGGASVWRWSLAHCLVCPRYPSDMFFSSSSWASRYRPAVWGHVTDRRPMECGINDGCHFQAWSLTASPMWWAISTCPSAVR